MTYKHDIIIIVKVLFVYEKLLFVDVAGIDQYE